MTSVLVKLRATSPRTKLVLAGICLALTGAGGALVLLSPARARLAALEARRAALQREVAQARIAVADLARHHLGSGELDERLELITQKLPTEREIPPVYRRLHEAAFSTGLAVVFFQPRDPRVQDHYTEIPIAVTAEGTYHQLATFLERVAAFPRVITVDALKLTALDRAPASLRAEMTLATYVYRPAGGAPATTPAGAKPSAPVAPSTIPPAPRPTTAAAVAGDIESPVPASPPYSPRGRRDPFGPPPSAPVTDVDPAARRGSAMASATLTGIVSGPDGPLALVELPDGTGYILRAGDGIGEARLIRIGRDSAVFDVPTKAGRGAERIVLTLGLEK